MTVVSALVVYAVIWFLALFVLLPLGLTSQAEDGSVVPGTPASAPARSGLSWKMGAASVIALLVTAAAWALITYGGFGVRPYDVWRIDPDAAGWRNLLTESKEIAT